MSDLSTRATDDLIAERDRAADAYYGGDGSPLTDDAFDSLTAELASRGVAEQVGHGATGGKIAHGRRMLSLKKVHDVADLEALLASHPDAAYAIEPKWDGLAASVRYGADGHLERALTRGDGERGEDITPAIREIFARQGFPLKLDGAGEVRGEIVMTRSKFNHNNEVLASVNEELLSNPRNAAAGLIAKIARNIGKPAKRDALAIAAAEAGRLLTFLAYDADGAVSLADRSTEATDLSAKPSGLTSHFARHLLPQSPFADHRTPVAAAVAWLDAKAELLDVETDGVVVKLTDPSLRAELGESSTAPRWALAYKFPNRPKQTVLRAVEWSETRTGRVVPTAVFDTVELSGAMVSRATLNNVAFLEELDVWIGDTIEVTRANEVIPNVVRRIGEHAAGATPIPGPDGWPIGAGVLCWQEFGRSRDNRLITVINFQPGRGDDIKLVTDFDGNRERQADLEDREYFDHSAFFAPPEFGDDIERSLAAAFDQDEMVFAVQRWLEGCLIAWKITTPYRREGRDFVHDNGTDPVKAISFAASKLDILGLGEDVVSRLLASNPEITDFPELAESFRFRKVLPFERGTQKLVDKLAEEIDLKLSEPQDPAKWIAAVGATGIGVRAGKKIAQAIADARGGTAYLDTSTGPFLYLHDMTNEEILSIPGFGEGTLAQLREPEVMERLWKWVGSARMMMTWDWSKYLPEANSTSDLAAPKSDFLPDEIRAKLASTRNAGQSAHPVQPLTGKRVLVTGTFPTLSRKQAEERIEEHGGTVASSVSKNLDLLIAGDKAGSKLAKAEALGIEVMAAAEFEELGR
ncbi:BRCT domain-containing protein [Leucobacter sp. cx-169]|uniref:BRCT domain-containing protein n=1 Tax=Leucobacter sp. cx-169 TaxID=2770549 RepID=UPI00165EA5CF|nr:BRCT domain-containing protein [Leucobacter sp. cx-169]MBC9927300.1 hypothetical protein [Leucobacter sp. cx-169]